MGAPIGVAEIHLRAKLPARPSSPPFAPPLVIFQDLNVNFAFNYVTILSLRNLQLIKLSLKIR